MLNTCIILISRKLIPKKEIQQIAKFNTLFKMEMSEVTFSEIFFPDDEFEKLADVAIVDCIYLWLSLSIFKKQDVGHKQRRWS